MANMRSGFEWFQRYRGAFCDGAAAGGGGLVAISLAQGRGDWQVRPFQHKKKRQTHAPVP